jgi:tRNA-specific 2-thiouridylase
MSGHGRKVVVAMSGGVDSSVAALMLMRQGWNVTGLFMRGNSSSGATETDALDTGCDDTDARRVAERLGIPLHVLDVGDGFQRLVDYFVDEYGRGRTPNPCIVCNRDLKFGRLLDYALDLGAEAIATGHYARVADGDGEPVLLRSADPDKDQSYALFAIPYARLGRIVLPLGGWTKAEVRRMAVESDLPVHDKTDSQDACFVAGDYADLIRLRRPELLRPGPIVDELGREVGRHQGIATFTIGQRRGVRVAFGRPRYVVSLDAATATVHVGPQEHLLAPGLRVEDVNWLTARPPRDGDVIEADVQIRYKHRAARARVMVRRNGADVYFREPQRAVTPGQAAVFYVGDRVLGGGWIARAFGVGDALP